MRPVTLTDLTLRILNTLIIFVFTACCRMDRIPVEIILEIASNLRIHELRILRLTSKCMANILRHVALAHLSFIDLSGQVDDFLNFVDEANIKLAVRRLTVYHGEWPVCTRQEWEIHPLQRLEIHPRYLSTRARPRIFNATIETAYESFHGMVTKEGSRNSAREREKWMQVFESLPNLEAIQITHLHARVHSNQFQDSTKLTSLRRQIWMSPLFNSLVNQSVTRVLQALPQNGFGRLQEICIVGRFDPGSQRLNLPMRQVKCLHMHSQKRVDLDSQNLQSFLDLFPCLQELSIHVSEGNLQQPSLQLGFTSKSLQSFHIARAWTTEGAISRLLNAHPHLQVLGLSDIMLTEGSWQSVFSRTVSLNDNLRISTSGYLNSLSYDGRDFAEDRVFKMLD